MAQELFEHSWKKVIHEVEQTIIGDASQNLV